MLSVAGAVYIATGYTYIKTDPTPARVSSLRLALEWLPLGAWGVIFILVGLLAVLSSKWPPASETWGYTTMTGLSALWAGFYLFGIFLGAPAAGFSGVLVWGLVAFMWWAVSGLVNPAAKAPQLKEA